MFVDRFCTYIGALGQELHVLQAAAGHPNLAALLGREEKLWRPKKGAEYVFQTGLEAGK